MAVNKKLFFVDIPSFNEFVFHVMKTANPRLKINMTMPELKLFKNDATIHKFANSELIDRKIVMLAKLGISFQCVFKPESTLLEDDVLENIEQQWASGDERNNRITKMAQSKYFVFGSKEVVESLQYAAQNSNSQLYVLNHDYVRIGQYLKDIKAASFSGEYGDAIMGFDLLSKMMALGSIMAEHTDTICGVDPFHMKILLAIYSFRTTYVTPNKIGNYLQQPLRNQMTTLACAKLFNEGYLHRIKNDESKRSTKFAYTILEKGIEAVGKYLKHLINSSLYQQ